MRPKGHAPFASTLAHPPHPRYQAKPRHHGDEQVEAPESTTSPIFRRGVGSGPFPGVGKFPFSLNPSFSLIFVFSLNRGAVTNSPLLLSRGPRCRGPAKSEKGRKSSGQAVHSTVQEEERDRARAAPGPSSAEPYPAAEVGGGPPRARGSGGPTRGRLFPALATSGGRTVGRAGAKRTHRPPRTHGL